jgi:hypothetical protein
METGVNHWQNQQRQNSSKTQTKHNNYRHTLEEDIQ